jgi:Tfp pilus assembly protein PilF
MLFKKTDRFRREKTMTTKTLIIMAATAAVVLTAAFGCDVGGARKQGAISRWEQTMEQVRLDAARESLAQGHYAYARKVLEPCMKSERSHEDAERLMAQIQAADQMYAQLASYREQNEQDQAY